MMSKCLTHPKILHLQPLRWMSMRPRTPTAGRQQVYIARGHWRGMGGRPARLAEPDEDRGARSWYSRLRVDGSQARPIHADKHPATVLHFATQAARSAPHYAVPDGVDVSNVARSERDGNWK